MLEILFTAKVLPVRVLDPAHDHGIIGQGVQVFEVLQPHHESRGLGGAAVVSSVQRAKFIVETRPIHLVGQPMQRVPLIK